MITDKILKSKFYLYAGRLHKCKKVVKTENMMYFEDLETGDEVKIPIGGGEILLSRLYTIGEVARIVERRSDTIRKYERADLIPRPSFDAVNCGGYEKWRFYKESDVYEIVEFFSHRSPGRPPRGVNSRSAVAKQIRQLSNKVNNLGVHNAT